MEQTELKEILKQHNLFLGANLRGANLEGADLHGANLRGANLEGADLHGANLEGADLVGADLRRANLYAANLTRANLKDANLTGAYLSGASLKDAKLRGANLSGANLSVAYLKGAILPDISWIIPGFLVQLNKSNYDFYLEKDKKYDNFVQDSFGFFIQDNPEEGTFDMLVEDRIIRNIPDWLKYTGLKQVLL